MDFNEFLIKSPKLDQISKPGIKSQIKMAPESREIYPKTNKNLRFAATTMLLYPINKVLYFCLIRRTFKTDIHSNQIGFPGGEKDASDKNYWDTALREMNEEIGVKPRQVKYITNLSKLFIPVSRFIVFPYMAITNKRPMFKIKTMRLIILLKLNFQCFC